MGAMRRQLFLQSASTVLHREPGHKPGGPHGMPQSAERALTLSGDRRERIYIYMWVRVPVIFVRCRDQANTMNDDGIRTTAKRSRAAIEGHN